MSAAVRIGCATLFLALAAAIWAPSVRVHGILRAFPARPLWTAVFVALALTMLLRRGRGGRASRFAQSSRWLLVAAWAAGLLALGVSQLVVYDDDCGVTAGAIWHPIATIVAAGALLLVAASTLAALVETVQRRAPAAALTLAGGFLSLYPFFVLALLTLVGCDNS
jgi:hypothetical protein